MLENDFYSSRAEALLNEKIQPLGRKKKANNDDQDIIKYDSEFMRKLTFMKEGSALILSKPLPEIQFI